MIRRTSSGPSVYERKGPECASQMGDVRDITFWMVRGDRLQHAQISKPLADKVVMTTYHKDDAQAGKRCVCLRIDREVHRMGNEL